MQASDENNKKTRQGRVPDNCKSVWRWDTHHWIHRLCASHDKSIDNEIRKLMITRNEIKWQKMK